NYTVEPIEGPVEGNVIYSGVGTVPAGSRDGVIVFDLADADITSSIKFKITLTSTSRSNVTAGLSDNSALVEHIVTLCANIFSASYAGSSSVGGQAADDFNVNLVPVAGTNNQF